MKNTPKGDHGDLLAVQGLDISEPRPAINTFVEWLCKKGLNRTALSDGNPVRQR